jgi:hypothetical protein
LYLRHLFLHEKMSGGNCALSGTAMQSYLRISPNCHAERSEASQLARSGSDSRRVPLRFLAEPVPSLPKGSE